MKAKGRTLLGPAICDIIRQLESSLSIDGQNIVEQSAILGGLTE
jgi:hypothetical protein